MEKLSIVVPCFNEQETIPLFYPATLAPALVQMITSPIITRKSKIWATTNAN